MWTSTTKPSSMFCALRVFQPESLAKSNRPTTQSLPRPRETAKLNIAIVGLQSNAPDIELPNLCPKVGSSRTRWWLFLCRVQLNPPRVNSLSFARERLTQPERESGIESTAV